MERCEDGSVVVSTQVLQEFYSVATATMTSVVHASTGRLAVKEFTMQHVVQMSPALVLKAIDRSGATSWRSGTRSSSRPPGGRLPDAVQRGLPTRVRVRAAAGRQSVPRRVAPASRRLSAGAPPGTSSCGGAAARPAASPRRRAPRGRSPRTPRSPARAPRRCRSAGTPCRPSCAPRRSRARPPCSAPGRAARAC